MSTHPRQGRATTVAALLATFLLVAGCGDDDRTTEGLALACEADVHLADQLLSVLLEAPETGADTTAENVEALRAMFDDRVAEHVDAFAENAPQPIAEEVAVLVDGYREAGRTADDTVLGSDEFEDAGATVDAYLFDECDQPAYTVTARDYAYDGLPTHIEPGTVRLRLVNEGAENHELALLARADGVTESWDELLGLPDDELLGRVRLVGVDDADAGGRGHLSGVVESGEYLVACFVPQGTVDGESPADGAPHHQLGMRQVVEVS